MDSGQQCHLAGSSVTKRAKKIIFAWQLKKPFLPGICSAKMDFSYFLFAMRFNEMDFSYFLFAMRFNEIKLFYYRVIF